MIGWLVDTVRELPPELATFLLAMLPFTELRAAIPIGVLAFDLPAPVAAIYGLIGNITIVALLLLLLDPATRLARHWTFADRVFERVFASTRRRHSHRFEEFRDVALVAFVAIPLPGTGGWAGALVAYLFGIRFRRAFPLVSAGLAVAATAVALLVASGSFVVDVTRH